MKKVISTIRLPKIHSFPKIFHIGERFIENLFKGEVEITEKIDGSQFDFGVDKNGEIVMRSKGQDLTYTDIPKMFKPAVEQVERLTPLLIKEYKDTYFYCEFLSKHHHNILNYERTPKNNLYLFGVQKGEVFISDFNVLCYYADMLEIEKPNLIYNGEIKDVNSLEKLLEEDSCLGKIKIEGIVVKNYEEPSIVGSMIIPISMGKYVSEKFKEKHANEWNTSFTVKGKLELFLESFKSEARWQKAVQHLKEKGELDNSPKDIGKLMVEIKKDILEEEKDNIKEALFRIFDDDITRKSTRGFPEWYKSKLLKNGFKNEM